MFRRLSRLSYNQLLLLKQFLQADGSVMTISQLEKTTPLHGKSLGGVLSAMSRTTFRGLPLIEPVGRSQDRIGLRWRVNQQALQVAEAKAEVERLLRTY